jgi:hypothetical protein
MVNMKSKKPTTTRYEVWEGDILRASQSTQSGAQKFMKPGRVMKTKIWIGLF